MILYKIGNLLESSADAYVNPVNTVGVMGKGIALQFKEAFPQNYKLYVKACKTKALDIGILFIHKEQTNLPEKIIINLPTKQDWRNPSLYEYVEKGLAALKLELQKGSIKSIAIPPLGCGHGGLSWAKVQPLMESYLKNLDVCIEIYAPNDAIKTHLQATTPSKSMVLTPKRAMLLYAMFQYELSMGENVNLFVANKLAYFLQRLGEPLRLTFQKAAYGPYSPQVGHVLYQLNGSYLKGLEQNEAKAFEPLMLDYDTYSLIINEIQTNLSAEQQTRLNTLQQLMEGFESFFALEVLASVDFLRQKDLLLSMNALKKGLAEWSPRKATQMSENYIQIALNRLETFF
jgi:O-acetyl-ADP-ribose deacetylase (regulator of RNase III)/uncharacterized protein YwgA